LEYKIFLTEDGSHSVELPGTNLVYHSRHGAVQESMHIFIGGGLKPILQKSPSSLCIFEVGFGTGLNALLTLAESGKYSTRIFYHAIDTSFLPESISGGLNFCKAFGLEKWQTTFHQMHAVEIGKKIQVSSSFSFLKSQMDIRNPEQQENIGLVYFDAFAPDDQPDLWTFNVFQKIYSWLLPGALLLTYSAKGEVRRVLTKAGFQVKKMPGPPGKREFILAAKQ
jgi:tRNA U34 5-methylaminomethyl-2-thiouridine-forming methyltransferase MnmC